jgi:hypothetical protein
MSCPTAYNALKNTQHPVVQNEVVRLGVLGVNSEQQLAVGVWAAAVVVLRVWRIIRLFG